MNPSNYGIKQVIVVRKDLNMRKGKIAAQVAHASNGCILKDYKFISRSRMEEEIAVECDHELLEWIKKDFAKVVVGCSSLSEIEEIEKKCIENDLRYCKITDNGTTEFHGEKTITCIAIGPHYCYKIDPITSGFPLL